MSVYDLIKKRRSIRRFEQRPIAEELLRGFVDAARLAPTGANLQPLKFKIVNDAELCRQIFAQTKWAGYLPDWNPTEKEAPTAYIAVCVDMEIKKAEDFCDIGAAAQNIFLTAQEQGIAACWLGAINKPEISRILHIEAPIKLHTVIALGYPAEQSETAEYTGSVKYYYDENGVLHVPKRSLEDVLL